ncbi:phosphotransferase enzyme family protein [Brachybacterium sacelli]|uniref:Ser/Thr protein kinase RdoA (MazF antagonist) n=1 Tax=Brachybacterium sacelli TaxID=173364 RepID=A0ABS4WWZ1_9MICO|nr:phosphotransferase [Brachybacterium sacelli]MBP2380717.1 Ser/Thr protein kinase RdoA (MazF antagonist) [Brachybacterium sacelli]
MPEPREVRIDGDTVRRPRKPWTETVHALLRHLREQDLPVPEPRGIDDRFEYVSLVPGLGGDGAWPDGVSADGARSLGRLLRRIHDATRGWTPPADAQWSVPHGSASTICHGDPKPGNVAWIDGRAVGLFDWDAARPGAPVADLAYALLWTTPIDVDPTGLQVTAVEAALRRERAAALLEGYGWSGPLDIVDVAVRRHELAIDEVEWLGERGHEPHASWVAQGWPGRWRDLLPTMRVAARSAFID